MLTSLCGAEMLQSTEINISLTRFLALHGVDAPVNVWREAQVLRAMSDSFRDLVRWRRRSWLRNRLGSTIVCRSTFLPFWRYG